MTTEVPVDANASSPSPVTRLPFKLAIVVTLAALADHLLLASRIGLSLPLFAALVAGGSWLANREMIERRRRLAACLLLLLGLLPAVEEVNALSLSLVIVALAAALMVATCPNLTSLREGARALRYLVLVGPLRFVPEALQVVSLSAALRNVAGWLVPLVLSATFVMLFAAANPLIERWILLLNPRLVLDHLSFGRSLFWAAMLSLLWPLIHVRWRKRLATPVEAPAASQAGRAARPSWLGEATILRSLILFNLLFAAQSMLDVLYLWGHAALPADITYAAYAHRGAYPLIVTALLAAGFVLAAMRPGGAGEKSPVIRRLVYLWVGQNLLLVASSILRLDIYVSVYVLTYWRIAAFIWMGLVAIGLALILARIVLGRSNEWLVGANLVALIGVLYVVAFVNFDAVIADYNMAHSRDIAGKGVEIDVNYLSQLGPQALPAIDRVLQLRPGDSCLAGRRDRLLELQRQTMASWRSWGFRSWRLQRWLDGRPTPQAS